MKQVEKLATAGSASLYTKDECERRKEKREREDKFFPAVGDNKIVFRI